MEILYSFLYKQNEIDLMHSCKTTNPVSSLPPSSPFTPPRADTKNAAPNSSERSETQPKPRLARSLHRRLHRRRRPCRFRT